MACKWTIAAAFGLCGLISACNNDRTEIQSAAPEEQFAPAIESHAVYDERLRDVMAGMQAATNENWPEKMDDEHTRPDARDSSLAFEKAQPLADALAKAAERIPDTIQNLVMVEADRRAFRAQSETLRDQARLLSLAAKKRDATEIRNVLHRIDATCRACHARFLDVSGPLSRL
jgi:hypothetical protein